jgi:hypothetical protein
VIPAIIISLRDDVVNREEAGSYQAVPLFLTSSAAVCFLPEDQLLIASMFYSLILLVEFNFISAYTEFIESIYLYFPPSSQLVYNILLHIGGKT